MGVRTALENYTMAQTYPDVIRFQQDGNGEWITSVETIADAKYNRPAHVTSVINQLINFGEQIPYVPVI